MRLFLVFIVNKTLYSHIGYDYGLTPIDCKESLEIRILEKRVIDEPKT